MCRMAPVRTYTAGQLDSNSTAKYCMDNLVDDERTLFDTLEKPRELDRSELTQQIFVVS